MILDVCASALSMKRSAFAKDLRELHKKDSNTGSYDTVFDEFMDTCEEVQKADSITQKQMLTYSKLFQMNFTKMDPYEFKTFMDIVERYSTAFKSAKGNGRGKKKRKLRFTACMDSRPRLRKA